MPNYEIIYTLVFCRLQFKKEKNPARKKRKTEIASVYVVTEICVLLQTSKLSPKKPCRNNISGVATP